MTGSKAANPLSAYQKTETAARPTADSDPREIEAWALNAAAKEIQAAMANGRRNDLRDALRKNLKLWTIFQAEAADETNPLPNDLRQNILALSRYIDRQTMQRLADLDTDGIRDLVSINMQLAEGLRGRPAESSQRGAGTAASGQTSSDAGASQTPDETPRKTGVVISA